MSQPFKATKKFGGKVYKYVTYEDTKSAAGSRADRYREHGGRARVTKEKSPMGRTYYAVWLRQY